MNIPNPNRTLAEYEAINNFSFAKSEMGRLGKASLKYLSHFKDNKIIWKYFLSVCKTYNECYFI